VLARMESGALCNAVMLLSMKQSGNMALHCCRYSLGLWVQLSALHVQEHAASTYASLQSLQRLISLLRARSKSLERK
jgi:hypothetical protein